MYKELSSTFTEPLHLDKSGQTVFSVNSRRVDGLFIRNGSDLHRYDGTNISQTNRKDKDLTIDFCGLITIVIKDIIIIIIKAKAKDSNLCLKTPQGQGPKQRKQHWS